jgi:hypothetical protein
VCIPFGPYAQRGRQGAINVNIADVIFAGRRNVSSTTTEATAADAEAAKAAGEIYRYFASAEAHFPVEARAELLLDLFRALLNMQDIRVPASFRSIVAFCF